MAEIFINTDPGPTYEDQMDVRVEKGTLTLDFSGLLIIRLTRSEEEDLLDVLQRRNPNV